MSLGPLYTGLSILLLPGQPILEPVESQPVSDTWSLSISDSAEITATTPPEHTELGAFLLPWTTATYSDKSADLTQDVFVGDAWLLLWTEELIDVVMIDTWDAWALTLSESAAIAIEQTFAAPDTWSLAWNDIASVLAVGPITPNVIDTWSLQLDESTDVAATIDSSDTWSLTWSDSASIEVSSSDITASDSWSLLFSQETAATESIVDVPILSSDEWRLAWDDGSSVLRISIHVPPKRVIRVDGPNRITRIE